MREGMDKTITGNISRMHTTCPAEFPDSLLPASADAVTAIVPLRENPAWEEVSPALRHGEGFKIFLVGSSCNNTPVHYHVRKRYEGQREGGLFPVLSSHFIALNIHVTDSLCPYT